MRVDRPLYIHRLCSTQACMVCRPTLRPVPPRSGCTPSSFDLVLEWLRRGSQRSREPHCGGRAPARRKCSGAGIGETAQPATPPQRARPRAAPAARATGAPISSANPKVRVSVIWLPERNPLRTCTRRGTPGATCATGAPPSAPRARGRPSRAGRNRRRPPSGPRRSGPRTVPGPARGRRA
jgi:hypothetical protein